MERAFRSIITLFATTAFVAASIMSCSSTDNAGAEWNRTAPTVPSERKTVSFTASIENGETKTQLEGLSILWSEEDEIRVFNAATPEGEVYTLTQGAGTVTGTFTGLELEGEGPYYAVYPASAALSFAGNTVRFAASSVQKYAENSFGPHANLAAGVADQLDDITFRNLFGVLKLTLTGSASIKSIRVLSDVDSDRYSGQGVISWQDGIPSASFDDVDSKAHEMTLDCGENGIQLSPDGTDFYITFPEGALEGGFTLDISDTENGAMSKHGKKSVKNRIDRSMILPMPVFSYEAKVGEPFLASEIIHAGVFINAVPGQKETETVCEYEPAQSQFSHLATGGENGSRRLRIQDWEKGFALTLTIPAEVQTGKSCPVSIEAVGDTGGIRSGENIPMTVVKQAGGRIWLSDPETGNGYVIMLED